MAELANNQLFSLQAGNNLAPIRLTVGDHLGRTWMVDTGGLEVMGVQRFIAGVAV